ncbi:MAG TPA: permease [Spirochaetota bacterium]|nr:permease [Spirochaetota bacterium]HPC42335.1 permease [Spirochaetota bacterium]HPL17851.1 permease [Spirochaetota bacterium]HQF10216.1 permease [Spirochaetota bacterium]HQH99362.1 permease [Spirochaetota bacterium]
MDWKTEWKPLFWIVAIFLLLFYLPIGVPRFDNAVFEALYLVKWYAQEHVLLCLVPAFFIAGAIAVFVSQESVMKYLGPTANKAIAYGVSSVSGTILAVCSCTVLPLFSGIYRMGAGLGPATAFLYSGPAINVLAIVLTARVLGMEIGIARAVGAVVFSVVIGLAMHFIYRKEEVEKANAAMNMPEPEVKRALWKNIIYFASMIAILVFANWGKPVETSGFWYIMYNFKWVITGASSVLFAVVLVLWFELKWWKVLIAAAPVVALSIIIPDQPILAFSAGAIGLSVLTSTDKGETGGWFVSTWDFAKQILPLLLFGVLIAGFLLGRVGKEGVIPNEWVAWAVGGNSLWANFFAAISGAFMYFATLTEVPIVQGLIGSGMGKGPALALLLAGPALSLPSMLVIKSVIGWQKTIVYVILVVVMATITGMIFGALF